MMQDAGLWRHLAVPFSVVVGAFAIYVATGQDACAQIERATAPIDWIARLHQHITGSDGGWNDYRAWAFAAAARSLGVPSTCEQVKRLMGTQNEPLKGGKGGVTDEERAIFLGR